MDKETKELLSKLQCNEIETVIFKEIQHVAAYANTRDDYARVARGLHLLSKTCEKGQLDARRLAAKILRDNPRKPAYREEIEHYEY
jgi:hypothetical protein